jgi:hypothetical protein
LEISYDIALQKEKSFYTQKQNFSIALDYRNDNPVVHRQPVVEWGRGRRSKP